MLHLPSYSRKPVLVTSLLVALALPLCAQQTAPDARPPNERIETFSHGPVTIELIASPALVDLSQNVQLTLRVTAPPHINVQVPPLTDRVTGFVIAGQYQLPAVDTDGKQISEAIYQLTPAIAEEYRIAPIPIVYNDVSHHPPQSHWFPTRPILFERLKLIDGPPPADISVELEPIWVRPAFRTVATWVLGALAGCGVLALIVYLLSPSPTA